jgi:hypothetical protein
MPPGVVRVNYRLLAGGAFRRPALKKRGSASI